MRLIQRLAAGRKEFSEEPPFWSLSSPSWWSGSTVDGQEGLPHDFETYVQHAYRSNGPVFAVVLARLMLFSEARFRWRREVDGRPGELFWSPSLRLLDRPWSSATTGALLARAEQDASMAGNFFATAVDGRGRYGRAATGPGARVRRMRPDWVTIVSGSTQEVRDGDVVDPDALDAQPVAVWYRPPGRPDSEVLLLADQVVHYAPIPDPLAHWRGMSWLTPVLREVDADRAATVHKAMFFRNGATPAMVASLDKGVRAADFQRFVELFNQQHQGAANAYKTLFLGGGADVKPLTMDMRQLDFKLTQGAGETRIAAAGGVPPIIVGLSEGLQSATYSNYGQARRRFADGTMRPLWRTAAAAFETLVGPPPEDGAQLWYDARDIAFLAEDQKDAAEIAQLKSATIRQLIDAGYSPDAVVAAVEADDFAQLRGQHSGLYSVQLQPPGAQQPVPADVRIDPEEGA